MLCSTQAHLSITQINSTRFHFVGIVVLLKVIDGSWVKENRFNY